MATGSSSAVAQFFPNGVGYLTSPASAATADRATEDPGTAADGTGRIAIAPAIVIGLVEDVGSQVADAGTPTTASEAEIGAATEIAIGTGTGTGTEASIRTKPGRLDRES